MSNFAEIADLTCPNYRVKTMPKLPTTFQTLDLTGFEFIGVSRGVSHRAQQYTGINREMVDFACAVLQKNRVG